MMRRPARSSSCARATMGPRTAYSVSRTARSTSSIWITVWPAPGEGAELTRPGGVEELRASSPVDGWSGSHGVQARRGAPVTCDAIVPAIAPANPEHSPRRSARRLHAALAQHQGGNTMKKIIAATFAVALSFAVRAEDNPLQCDRNVCSLD